MLWRRITKPIVGQVWVSEYSGRSMRVVAVGVGFDGNPVVDVQHETSLAEWGPMVRYSHSPEHWKRLITQERRVLQT